MMTVNLKENDTFRVFVERLFIYFPVYTVHHLLHVSLQFSTGTIVVWSFVLPAKYY